MLLPAPVMSLQGFVQGWKLRSACSGDGLQTELRTSATVSDVDRLGCLLEV
jgi:hypothetical protein